MSADRRFLLSSQLSVGMRSPAIGPSVRSVVVRRLSTSVGFVGRLPSVRLSPLAGRGHLSTGLSTTHLDHTLDHACQPCSRSRISVVLSATPLGRASRPYSRPLVSTMLVQLILFGCVRDAGHLFASSAVAMRRLSLFRVVLVRLPDCLCLVAWHHLSDCRTFVRSYGHLCHRRDTSSSSSDSDSEDDEPVGNQRLDSPSSLGHNRVIADQCSRK